MRERATEIINRRQLGSTANNTKWREFFAEVQSLDASLEFKLIDEEQPFSSPRFWSPAPNYVEGGLMGPYPFYWVEWVRSREVASVVALAATVGLECIVEDGYATVYGYR